MKRYEWFAPQKEEKFSVVVKTVIEKLQKALMEIRCKVVRVISVVSFT